MSGKTFVVREFVRWGDVDPAGIIRYDAYTRFFEIAEGDFFRTLGLKYRELFTRLGVGIPRRVMHIDFLSPPVLDEELEVHVYVSQMGETSMTLNFDFYGPSRVPRAIGYLVVVCVTADGNMVKRSWPPELRELIRPYILSVEDARRVD